MAKGGKRKAAARFSRTKKSTPRKPAKTTNANTPKTQPSPKVPVQASRRGQKVQNSKVTPKVSKVSKTLTSVVAKKRSPVRVPSNSSSSTLSSLDSNMFGDSPPSPLANLSKSPNLVVAPGSNPSQALTSQQPDNPPSPAPVQDSRPAAETLETSSTNPSLPQEQDQDQDQGSLVATDSLQDNSCNSNEPTESPLRDSLTSSPMLPALEA